MDTSNKGSLSDLKFHLGCDSKRIFHLKAGIW